MGIIYNLKLKLSDDNELLNKIKSNPDILLYCCKQHVPSVVKRIINLALKHDLNLTFSDSDGINPLMYTILEYDYKLCELLAKYNPLYVTTVNNKLESCYEMACRVGAFDLALLFVGHHPEIINTVNSNGNNSLMILLEQLGKKKEEVQKSFGDMLAKSFIDLATPTSHRDSMDYTMDSFVKLAIYLITHRCNLTQINNENETALIMACEGGLISEKTGSVVAEEIVKQHDYLPGHVDSYKMTALMHCCEKKLNTNQWQFSFNYQNIIRDLVKRSDNLAQIDIYKNDALIYACAAKNSYAASILVKTKLFDGNRKNRYHETAISYAANNEMYNILPDLTNDVVLLAAVKHNADARNQHNNEYTQW
jgi:ankyrin repeat protein